VAEASGTIKALCEEYMKRHALAKKRSWKNDKSYIDRILVPNWVHGSRRASRPSISPRFIPTWVQSIRMRESIPRDRREDVCSRANVGEAAQGCGEPGRWD